MCIYIYMYVCMNICINACMLCAPYDVDYAKSTSASKLAEYAEGSSGSDSDPS